MLTWWYPDQKGMGWHVDGYGGNNGDQDAPVYSLTVGNTCIFEWNPVEHPDIIESAEICSGDVIIFGGPERMMRHRVKKILLNTFTHPDLEYFNARINITFRKLENFTPEDEKEFQTDVYEERVLKEYQTLNKR